MLITAFSHWWHDNKDEIEYESNKGLLMTCIDRARRPKGEFVTMTMTPSYARCRHRMMDISSLLLASIEQTRFYSIALSRQIAAR